MPPLFFSPTDLTLSQTKFVILSRGQWNMVTLPQNIMSFFHSLKLFILCESHKKKKIQKPYLGNSFKNVFPLMQIYIFDISCERKAQSKTKECAMLL